MSLSGPPLTTLPSDILSRQSDLTLRTAAFQAFLALQPNMDTSQGQFPYDLIETFCLVLAQAYVDLVNIETRTSLSTAIGPDLDRLGDLYGITRGPSAFATGTVTFTGLSGASIPVNTIVSTTGPSAQYFTTTTAAAIGVGGTVDVPVTATVAGSAGNVASATVTQISSPPINITAVTNAAAFAGGANVESDGAVGQYISGYRADIHSLNGAHGEGGAAKHLRKWARAVAGVGAVSVLDATPTGGWATIALLGTALTPASSAITLAVEAYILDPWYLYYEAENQIIGGFGSTLASQSDATPLGGTNNCVAMTYNASGNGSVIQQNLASILPQPGIWRFKPRIKRGSSVGTGNLVQFGVWNTSNSTWCTTRPNNNGVPANQTLTGAQLSATFIDPILDVYQDFAWNGTDVIEARLLRLTSDTTTQIWVDQFNYWATMSRSDRDVGLSPAGMRLFVEPAGTVTINISATLTYGLLSGQTTSSVQTAAAANVAAYLASIAFQTPAAVRRAAVEDAIFNTPGVADVTNVQLNGSTNNVSIGPTQVAVLGTSSWS